MYSILICLIAGISDGDTLTARCPTEDADHPYKQVKVRLSAIDAPESRQPFGEKSRQHLAQLCFQRQARITPRATDRYKRTVADVECQGQDAGQAQVQAGMAWVYTQYAKGYTALPALEQEARAKRAGLWADQEPVAPWEWRRQR